MIFIYIIAFKILSIVVLLLISVAYFIIEKRKRICITLIRRGLNFIKLLQPLADSLKLFIKKIILLNNVSINMFLLKSVLAFILTTILIGWAVIVFSLKNNYWDAWNTIFIGTQLLTNFDKCWIDYCFDSSRFNKDAWSVREKEFECMLPPELLYTFQVKLPYKHSEVQKYLKLWEGQIWEPGDNLPLIKAQLVLIKKRPNGQTYEWKSWIVRITAFSDIGLFYRNELKNIKDGAIVKAAFRLHIVVMANIERLENLKKEFDSQVLWHTDTDSDNYQYYKQLYASDTRYENLLQNCIKLKQYKNDNAPYIKINRVRSIIRHYINKVQLDPRLTNLSLDELESIQDAINRDDQNNPFVKKINGYLNLMYKDSRYLQFLEKCIKLKKCLTAKAKNRNRNAIQYYVNAGLDKNLKNLTLPELNVLQKRAKENKAELLKSSKKPLQNLDHYLNLVRKDSKKYEKFVSKCIIYKECCLNESLRKEKNAARVSARYYIKKGLDADLLQLSLEELKILQKGVKENKAELLKFSKKPLQNLDHYLNLARKDPRKYKKFVSKCIIYKECCLNQSSRKEKNAARVSARYYIKRGLDADLLQLSLEKLKILESKLSKL